MKKAQIRSFRKTLRRFERLLGSQLKDNSCCNGVTMAQCHALLEIQERGQMNLVRLVKNLGLDKSTLSRTVDGLVNIGLVMRVPDPSDRRVNLITLTDQGRATCNRLNSTNDDYYGQVINRVLKQKREDVIESFGLLVRAMEEQERHVQNKMCCNKPPAGKVE